jgi:hypothetical protein
MKCLCTLHMAALYWHFFRIFESERSSMLKQISKRKSDRVDYQKLRCQHKCPWPRYSHITDTQVTKFTHHKTERRPFLNIPTHKVSTLHQQDATFLTWSEQSASFLDLTLQSLWRTNEATAIRMTGVQSTRYATDATWHPLHQLHEQ